MKTSAILVADDHAHIRRLVHQSLKRGGYEHFSFATTGSETLLIARTHTPDIILLDFDMPELDGLAALYELRTDPLTRNIPVIMMSGYAEFEPCFEAHARSSGAQNLLPKPFAPSMLLDVVRETLNARKAA